MHFGVELRHGAVTLWRCVVWCTMSRTKYVRVLWWCGAQEVMVVAGTKPQYNVDVYSGNHPFYQGHKTFMVMDEGQLNKFKKRFDGLGEELNIVPTLQAGRWAYAGSWVVIACHVRVGPMPCHATPRHAGGRSHQTQDGLHASIPANATSMACFCVHRLHEGC